MSKSKVYSSPIKRSRRLDIKVLNKADKYISRRPYAPGQHGQSRRSKMSDYALQLQEKQRAKFIYGLRERQFHKLFIDALKSSSATGERLLQLLETRLDNLVYRCGMARTRRQARQLITHGHFSLNGRIVTIPSYHVVKDDNISPKAKETFNFHEIDPVPWLKIDKKNKSCQLLKIPSRTEIPSELDEQLIIEFYSR